MPKGDGGNGDNDQENGHDDDQETDWVEKHLVKIIISAGLVCVLGLVGRALTG